MKPWLLLCLAAAGCAPAVANTARDQDRAAAQATKLDKALAGLTPGKAESCLSAIDRRIARTTTYGSTVLFRVSNSRIFRNDMNGDCAVGSYDPIFVTQTPTGSLCRGDIVQVLDRGSRFPVGSCSYGEFVPYNRAK